jgi:hypothetical protein
VPTVPRRDREARPARGGVKKKKKKKNKKKKKKTMG